VCDALMRLVTRLGNPTVVIPIAAFFSFGLAPALHHAGIVAAWSLGLSHAVVHVLKRSIRRGRPQLPVGAASMIEPEDLFSLPSGHAAAGLTVALPLFLALTGPVAYTVLALGSLVGVSRCYLASTTLAISLRDGRSLRRPSRVSRRSWGSSLGLAWISPPRDGPRPRAAAAYAARASP
jgi:hypothetical protein